MYLLLPLATSNSISPVHPLNAHNPIATTLLGMKSEVSPVQSVNAKSEISTTLICIPSSLVITSGMRKAPRISVVSAGFIRHARLVRTFW